MIDSRQIQSAHEADSRKDAVLELIDSHAARLKRHSRRYSLCRDDAEDAYQRALEILLTKAPSGDPVELLRWIQTVLKHEAMAVRRKRARLMAATDQAAENCCDQTPTPHELAQTTERAVRVGATFRRLKRQELICLFLKAAGYSYRDISELTGYSWTKVNRSISEGRKSFLEQFKRLEAVDEKDAI